MIAFTPEYRQAVEMTQAFKEHIWVRIEGKHRMRTEFDRKTGNGHIYCISCHKVVWESQDE